jgi:hypothetical protein
MIDIGNFIETEDDFLSREDHEAIYNTLRGNIWRYGWKSLGGQANTKKIADPFSYWHVDFCGTKGFKTPTIEEYNAFRNEWPSIENLWTAIVAKYQDVLIVKDFYRCYANAHTYGNAGSIHYDDGDITFIYYPNLEWDPSWFGGTAIYSRDKSTIEHTSMYKPNRLMSFTASKPHVATGVARECDQLRTVVVFKSKLDVNSYLYRDYYDKLNESRGPGARGPWPPQG